MRHVKHLTKTAALALVLSASSVAPAFAGFCDALPMFCDDDGNHRSSRAATLVPPQPGAQPGAAPAVTPEIDPGMLSGTLAILAGGMLILAGKRRRC